MGGEAGGVKRERESPADSLMRAELDLGLDPTIQRPGPEPKPRVRDLTY